MHFLFSRRRGAISFKSGFSLAAVLVAVGIMSLMMMALTSFFSQSFKSERGLKNKFTRTELGKFIDMILSKREFCKNAFKAGASDNTAAKFPGFNGSSNRMGPFELRRLAFKGETTAALSITKKQIFDGVRVEKIVLEKLSKDPVARDFPEIGENLYLASIRVTVNNSNGTGGARLETNPKRTFVIAEKGTGKIEGCLPIGEGAALEMSDWIPLPSGMIRKVENVNFPSIMVAILPVGTPYTGTTTPHFQYQSVWLEGASFRGPDKLCQSHGYRHFTGACKTRNAGKEVLGSVLSGQRSTGVWAISCKFRGDQGQVAAQPGQFWVMCSR